jgi:peptide/nickel transport system ATP-binding protein
LITPDPLLQVSGLSVRFNGTSVVEDVHFTLHKGECIGLVGASGSGKSVTSLALLRLLDPKVAEITGSVRYRGKEISTLDDGEFRSFRGREFAMVFQEPMTALDPVYRVGDQVAEAILLHERIGKREARKRVIGLFEEVHLPEPEALYDRYPHQLSGGQKQRVVISMALSCSPSVLVCDEPTTALDVLVQREIIDLLKRIQKSRDMAMIFITHDLGVVREIATRALVMHQGKVVEKASVEDLFTAPRHPYTKGLIACRPDPTRHPRRLPTIEEVMRSPDHLEGMEMISAEERRGHVERLLSQEPLLRVEGLDKSHARREGMFAKQGDPIKVLHDIGFSLHPGETLGVVGGSGSGKTTLGRSILRLIEPTHGRVWYRPEGSAAPLEITQLDAEAMRRLRRDLQIIFQDPYSSLNPRISIGRAIMEAMRVHHLGADDRERKEKIIALLERVGLQAAHFDRFPHQFSGGQRQRVVIARAIALEPRLIICDESVAALDVSVQAQVLNLLNELKEEHGLTYIFISHDLSVVKYFCDRVLVLEKGRMVELRPSDEIYDDPHSPYTKQLLNAIPGRR